MARSGSPSTYHLAMRSFVAFTVAALTNLVFTLGVAAQGHPGLVAISVGSGSSPTDLEAVEALITSMRADGHLVLQSRHGDNQIPGRQHEGFGQYFGGLPVHGASISRQTEAGIAVSIFGTIYTDIDIDLTPSLSVGEAATLLESSGVSLLENTARLTIVPTLDGQFALTYRMIRDDVTTSYVDAHTGDVVMEVDERKEQSAVGQGRGVGDDLKKVSSTKVPNGFEARDQLRPGEILTLDVRTAASLNRFELAGVVASDTATDEDNTWTNPAIVDTHVHSGWTFDYFFKRHEWSGLDDLSTKVYAAAATDQVAPNNAFFLPPPFGPRGNGGLLFGETSQGTPITPLDVVAHEFMHGVTHFGVSRRSGDGLSSFISLDGLGPTGIVLAGQFIPCSDLVLLRDGTTTPFLCSAGRFALASNHGGAINEAISDMFGTSTEFFYQPAGTGVLQADYLILEDVPELGSAVRSLEAPRTRFLETGSSVRYPEHYSRRVRFTVVDHGSQGLEAISLAVVDNQFFSLTGIDNGGVHWNSTILSHAFYLAIEGSSANASPSVSGIGAANRHQMEQVFFRAITQLMPGTVTMPDSAAVICQAAVDLFGHDSSVAQAVDQALYAVGLRPEPAISWCRAV